VQFIQDIQSPDMHADVLSLVARRMRHESVSHSEAEPDSVDIVVSQFRQLEPDARQRFLEKLGAFSWNRPAILLDR